MEQKLTGNPDTDANIIMQLSLADRRKLCQTNNYLSNLCKTNEQLKYSLKSANNNVDNFMDILYIRELILLQPTTINMTFKNIYDIINNIKITVNYEYIDEDEYLEIIRNLMNKYIYLIGIEYNKTSKQYYINIYSHTTQNILNVYNMYDPPNINNYGYEVSLNQLHDFLLQLFYNKMILNF